MAVTDALHPFLSWLAAAPFGYDGERGEFDCMTAAGAWMKLATGKDPVAPHRGRYRTEAGAARHMKRAGGAVALLGSGAAAVGWSSQPRARRGDVGVIEVVAPDGEHREAAAICTAPAEGINGHAKPPRWAMFGAGGVVCAAHAWPRAVWGPN